MAHFIIETGGKMNNPRMEQTRQWVSQLAGAA
jgi:hypothetical protein